MKKTQSPQYLHVKHQNTRKDTIPLICWNKKRFMENNMKVPFM